MPIQIQTDRLLLREMTQADFPALCQMLYDPVVMKAYEGAFTQAEAQAWLDRQISRYRKDGLGLWAVVLRETGRMIGQCGLTWQEADGRTVLEVGYLFSQAYWHRGYATEAARACRDLPLTPLAPKRCIPSSAIPTPPAALWRCAQRHAPRRRLCKSITEA